MNSIQQLLQRFGKINRNVPLVMGASVEYKTQILDAATGAVIKDNPWKRNLILNQGLDRYGTDGVWANLTTWARVGTGTTPVRRDSGSVLFTRSGSTVTSSGNFFEAADVGRILKLNDSIGTGSEMTITAFTNATTVTVSVSGTISAPGFSGTVWYVNRTGLQTQVKETNTYSTTSNDCETTYSTGVYSLKRAYLFTTETGTVTYTEAGWGWASGNGNTFGLDLINGGIGDTLIAGQQYKVFVTLKVAVNPYLTPVTYTTPISGVAVNANGVKCGTGNFNPSNSAGGPSPTPLVLVIVNSGIASVTNSTTAGSLIFSGLVWDHLGQTGSKQVQSFGANRFVNNNITLSTDSSALVAEANYTVTGSLAEQAYTESITAYTGGSYTRSKSFVYNVNNGNSTSLRSISINQFMRWLFASNWTKTNLQQLTITLTWSWNRVLLN